jgi:hypothetical protein
VPAFIRYSLLKRKLNIVEPELTSKDLAGLTSLLQDSTWPKEPYALSRTEAEEVLDRLQEVIDPRLY